MGNTLQLPAKNAYLSFKKKLILVPDRLEGLMGIQCQSERTTAHQGRESLSHCCSGASPDGGETARVAGVWPATLKDLGLCSRNCFGDGNFQNYNYRGDLFKIRYIPTFFQPLLYIICLKLSQFPNVLLFIFIFFIQCLIYVLQQQFFLQ